MGPGDRTGAADAHRHRPPPDARRHPALLMAIMVGNGANAGRCRRSRRPGSSSTASWRQNRVPGLEAAGVSLQPRRACGARIRRYALFGGLKLFDRRPCANRPVADPATPRRPSNRRQWIDASAVIRDADRSACWRSGRTSGWALRRRRRLVAAAPPTTTKRSSDAVAA